MLYRWLFLSLVLAAPAGAVDYYVDPSGSDAGPGSQAQPWQTVQKAADTLKPGDAVFVHTGIYGKVTVNVSGSARGGYVTFANVPGETPVIDATGVTPPEEDTALFLISNRSYVIVDGFELRNYTTTDPAPTPAGVFLRGACRHVEIRHCDIHGIENTGGNPASSGNAFGIAVYGSSLLPATDIVIDGNNVHNLKTGSSESVVVNGNVSGFRVTNNTVHDNNNIGIDFAGYERTCPSVALDRARNGVCRGNTVWNISSQGNQAYHDGDYSADGIYCDGAAAITIERNVVHDCDIAVELASEHPGRLSYNIVLRDNFISGSKQSGLLLGGYAPTGTGGTSRCAILRNTFYNNDGLQGDAGEVQLRSRTSGCVVMGNIFYSGAGNFCVTVPVAASQNVRNVFDYNLYFTPGGATTAQWSWNNLPLMGLAAWQHTSRQDRHAIFADPLFVATGATPDLHLQTGSPAVNAANPATRAAAGETDIDGGPRVSGGRMELGADELAP